MTTVTTPLPEPVLSQKYHHDPRYDIAYYTADQLRAYGAAEFQRGIDAAAKVCQGHWYAPGNDITPLIRLLGETP